MDIMYSFYRLEQGASLEDGTPRRRAAIKRLPLEAPVSGFAPRASHAGGMDRRIALCTHVIVYVGVDMVHVLGLSPRGLSPSSSEYIGLGPKGLRPLRKKGLGQRSKTT